MAEYKYRAKITKRVRKIGYDWELQRIRHYADTWTNYVSLGDYEPEWEAIAWGDEITEEQCQAEARKAQHVDEERIKAEEEAIYVDLD